MKIRWLVFPYCCLQTWNPKKEKQIMYSRQGFERNIPNMFNVIHGTMSCPTYPENSMKIPSPVVPWCCWQKDKKTENTGRNYVGYATSYSIHKKNIDSINGLTQNEKDNMRSPDIYTHAVWVNLSDATYLIKRYKLLCIVFVWLHCKPQWDEFAHILHDFYNQRLRTNEVTTTTTTTSTKQQQKQRQQNSSKT